jgi:uncharacterized protein GlcG (DUF336 family)
MRPLAILLLAALATPALAQNGPPPGPPRPAGPSVDLAREAATAAVHACERMGYKTMATVVDTTGRPVAAMTADPALNDTLAPESVRSAEVAAYFHNASSIVADRAKEEAGIYYSLHQYPQLEHPQPGGVPLVGPANPRGAIGVAGAPDGAKDEACAEAGAAKVAPQLIKARR